MYKIPKNHHNDKNSFFKLIYEDSKKRIFKTQTKNLLITDKENNLHNENGPSVIHLYGEFFYYKNGKLYREKYPHFISYKNN